MSNLKEINEYKRIISYLAKQSHIDVCLRSGGGWTRIIIWCRAALKPKNSRDGRWFKLIFDNQIVEAECISTGEDCVINLADPINTKELMRFIRTNLKNDT